MEMKASVCWRRKYYAEREPIEQINLTCPHHVATSFSGAVFILYSSVKMKSSKETVNIRSEYFNGRVITSVLDASSPLPSKLLGHPCVIYNNDAVPVIDFLRILAFLPCPPHSRLLTFSCVLQFNIFLHVTSFVDSAQLFSFLSSLHYHPSFLLSPGVSLP